jgi:hypothetical protein
MFKNGVASYTPIMTRFQKDMVGQTFVCDLVRRYANDVWTTDADSSVEMCEFSGLEIWSDQGWTALHRVVRYVQMTYEPPSSVLRHLTPLHREAKLRFRQGFHRRPRHGPKIDPAKLYKVRKAMCEHHRRWCLQNCRRLCAGSTALLSILQNCQRLCVNTTYGGVYKIDDFGEIIV